MTRTATRPADGKRFNPESLRRMFPLLAAAGKHLHYLDNAATTHKPAAVIDAIGNCYTQRYAAVHRGLYDLAAAATEVYEAARSTIGSFLGAASDADIIFTRGATESINLAATGWARNRLRAGDEVWVTAMEHHSNFLPWQAVCKASGARLRILHCDAHGVLQELPPPSSRHVGLFAITHVSNVLGIINPIAALIRQAHERGIPVLVDGAQAIGHIPVDVGDLGCDFYAFSAHKMYGPTGIGVLYANAARRAEMQPLLLGGGMVDEVGADDSSWLPAPARFEAGSPNLAGAAGLAEAARFIEAHMPEEAQEHVRRLRDEAIWGLEEIPGVVVYGPPANARQYAGIVAFNVEEIHPHDVAQTAASAGVALRAGHHCCQPLMRVLATRATLRASFAPYNTHADVAALLQAIEQAIAAFR